MFVRPQIILYWAIVQGHSRLSNKERIRYYMDQFYGDELKIKNFNGSTPCVTTTMYILGLFYIPPDHWKVHRLRFSRLLLHLEEKSREGNLLHT